MGDWYKCPRCGKQYLDEWEMFEHEHNCAVSCFTCKHSKTASLQEPCAGCRNRDKWEERKDGENITPDMVARE